MNAFSMNIPHLLTKSFKTPLYKGVFRGDVCPRYLTRTSLDDSPQVWFQLKFQVMFQVR